MRKWGEGYLDKTVDFFVVGVHYSRVFHLKGCLEQQPYIYIVSIYGYTLLLHEAKCYVMLEIYLCGITYTNLSCRYKKPSFMNKETD